MLIHSIEILLISSLWLIDDHHFLCQYLLALQGSRTQNRSDKSGFFDRTSNGHQYKIAISFV